MKYFKRYKDDSGAAFEITKEEARRTLAGYWKEEALRDIFSNEKSFRLYTPVAEVWTETDAGLVPMPGFYGIA